MDLLVFEAIDILGTLVFAISGAIVGIRQRLDMFGVMMTALVTATGGGVMRDVILGVIPPSTFLHCRNALLSMAVAILVFILVRHRKLVEHRQLKKLNGLYIFSDALGLALFVVAGINVGVEAGYGGNLFLLVFVGVLTGVGGGILRDLFSGIPPQVLKNSDVYASAGVLGALLYCFLLYLEAPLTMAMVIAVVVIVGIRMGALGLHWALPVAHMPEEKDETS